MPTLKQTISLLTLLTLTSCASFAGLGGKAHYVQTFEDTEGGTVGDDGTVVPGQSTKYSLDIKGPAGMKWEEITSMSYNWSPTEGSIGVNSASKGDTLATAEAIKAVIPVLTDSITSAITAGLKTAIEAAVPVISQNIESKRSLESERIEAKRDTVNRVIERLPEPQPVDVPVVPAIPTNPLVGVGEPPVAPPLAPTE